MNLSKDFEQINFNPSIFFNDEDQQGMRNPDLNYINDLNSNNFDSPYVLKTKYDNLPLIHVNIKSINSNLEKLHDLLLNCSNSYKIICVTEA